MYLLSHIVARSFTYSVALISKSVKILLCKINLIGYNLLFVLGIRSELFFAVFEIRYK